jgi:hypothetical protein
MFLAGVLAASARGQADEHKFVCMVLVLSYSETVAQADAVCLAKWVSSSKPSSAGDRDATFEIVEILAGPPQSVRQGDRCDFRFSPTENEQGLCLLCGSYDPTRRGIVWGSPTATTRACFDYIAHAPGAANQPKQLAYVAQFVNTREKLIRADVLQELKDARVVDLQAAAAAMPRDTLRKFIARSETPDELPGFACYLLALSDTVSSQTVSFKTLSSQRVSSQALSSQTVSSQAVSSPSQTRASENAADLKRLEAKIAGKWPKDFYRPGTDYMMVGYLLLAGEAGLDRLDAWKIKDRSTEMSDAYCEMMALRFLWRNGNGKLSHDRLIQSMRLVLDRADLVDIAIADLYRWHDWQSLDRIIGLYGQGPFNTPSIKRAIIRYLRSCAESKPKFVRPEQAAAAKKVLAEIGQKDPKHVAEVARNWDALREDLLKE